MASSEGKRWTVQVIEFPQRVFRDLTNGVRVALEWLRPLIGAAFIVTLMVGLFVGPLYLLWIAATLGVFLVLDGFEAS